MAGRFSARGIGRQPGNDDSGFRPADVAVEEAGLGQRHHGKRFEPHGGRGLGGGEGARNGMSEGRKKKPRGANCEALIRLRTASGAFCLRLSRLWISRKCGVPTFSCRGGKFIRGRGAVKLLNIMQSLFFFPPPRLYPLNLLVDLIV